MYCSSEKLPIVHYRNATEIWTSISRDLKKKRRKKKKEDRKKLSGADLISNRLHLDDQVLMQHSAAPKHSERRAWVTPRPRRDLIKSRAACYSSVASLCVASRRLASHRSAQHRGATPRTARKRIPPTDAQKRRGLCSQRCV